MAQKTGSASLRGFRGALRVSPDNTDSGQRSVTERSGGHELAAQVGAPVAHDSAPTTAGTPYATSLLLLFPAEAVAVFPLGKAAVEAGVSADHKIVMLWLVIASVGLFVGVLRYFGTQSSDGSPAWREIIFSLVSYLLWVGSSGGYPSGGRFGLAPDATPALFAFLIAMWVTVAPFFVKKRPGTTPPVKDNQGSGDARVAVPRGNLFGAKLVDDPVKRVAVKTAVEDQLTHEGNVFEPSSTLVSLNYTQDTVPPFLQGVQRRLTAQNYTFTSSDDVAAGVLNTTVSGTRDIVYAHTV